MAASPKPESTAIARVDETQKAPSKYQHIIDENKARNQLVAQIRGTIWGREVNDTMARAVAQYCRENQLDAVRHVEVLGGRIYLTAEFYDERGAELLRSGVIVPQERDYINADARLDELAKMGDSWACDEELRRKRERIRWSVPEDAKAAVVQRFIIAENGKAVVGVNWCGHKTGKKDPVGEAEPAKTAQTRARRRAWKQIADVIPGYAAVVRPIEERARALPVMTIDAPEQRLLSNGAEALPTRGNAMVHNDGYDTLPVVETDERGRPAVRETTVGDSQADVGTTESDDDLLAQDRELAAEEGELPLGDTPRRGCGTRIED